MLAKIKYDEDRFNRPLAIGSNWYNLSRSKVDYRQITFDRINRERPGLTDAMSKKTPKITLFPPKSSINKKSMGLPENSKYYPDSSFYIENYPPLLEDYNLYVKRTPNPTEFFEDDVFYAYRYDAYNYWWFDICLAPQRYVLDMTVGGTAGGTSYVLDFTTSTGEGIIDYSSTDPSVVNKIIQQRFNTSPSRDLATNTFLQFASMQNNPQSFIRKTSYLTAPYMPYVEQNKFMRYEFSKNVFFIGNPTDRNGIHANIYGIGDILEVFNLAAPSCIDRVNRQNLFFDYFKSLDSANWLEADKLADKLIQITDANGWAPYIGYGDLSLFIQRMNIPMEYIMTHALTDFQDEVLTNAYAINQLNVKIMDTVYQMQSDIVKEEMIILDPKVDTSIGYVDNITPDLLYDKIIQSTNTLRDAVSTHISLGGSIPDVQTILSETKNFNDAVDVLEAKATEVVINKQLELIDKAQSS